MDLLKQNFLEQSENSTHWMHFQFCQYMYSSVTGFIVLSCQAFFYARCGCSWSILAMSSVIVLNISIK